MLFVVVCCLQSVVCGVLCVARCLSFVSLVVACDVLFVGWCLLLFVDVCCSAVVVCCRSFVVFSYLGVFWRGLSRVVFIACCLLFVAC